MATIETENWDDISSLCSKLWLWLLQSVCQLWDVRDLSLLSQYIAWPVCYGYWTEVSQQTAVTRSGPLWWPGNTGDNHSAISAPCHVIADTQAVVMVFSMRCVEVGGATLSTDWWWLPVPCAVWEKFLPSHRLTLNITAQYTMELKFFSCESIFINR